MTRIFTLALLATLVGTAVHADPTTVITTVETNTPAAPVWIGADDAAKHIDQSVVVTGMVAHVSIRPKVVFLDIDKAYPDAPFTVVIMAANTNGFGDLNALKGKSVAITGKIKSFKDKPEIVVASTNQLSVTAVKMDASEKK